MIYVIDTVHEDRLVAPIKDRLGVEAFAVVIIVFEGDNYDKKVIILEGRGSYSYT